MGTCLIIAAAWIGGAAAEGPRLGLDPLVGEVGRWTVAIRVDREPERPGIPEILRRARASLPQEVVDYYTRPVGPVTGILLDAEGNVLTSFYNVAGKVKSIEVILPTGEVRPARLVAADEADDLALVRTAEPLRDVEVPPVKWADPSRLRQGRIVIAVGRSPDPTRPTATFGIVSSIGPNGGRAFQTDAKLDYGNVGGPIADLDGAVLGVACFVGHTHSVWGINSGIGFGTTAATVRSVLPRLLRGETVEAPQFAFLGVGPSSQAPPGNAGARIGEISKDSPAERGGLRVDDVVLSIGGEKVEDFVELRRLINRHLPGEEVVLKVRRGNRELELKIRLERRRG